MEELRTEITRRLGPPAKDPEEIGASTVLFPKTKFPSAQDNITSMTVEYAPYLRRLGLQLKRKQIPRAAPKALHFYVERALAQHFGRGGYALMREIRDIRKVGITAIPAREGVKWKNRHSGHSRL